MLCKSIYKHESNKIVTNILINEILDYFLNEKFLYEFLYEFGVWNPIQQVLSVKLPIYPLNYSQNPSLHPNTRALKA